jgi:hypothetical protein
MRLCSPWQPFDIRSQQASCQAPLNFVLTCHIAGVATSARFESTQPPSSYARQSHNNAHKPTSFSFSLNEIYGATPAYKSDIATRPQGTNCGAAAGVISDSESTSL